MLDFILSSFLWKYLFTHYQNTLQKLSVCQTKKKSWKYSPTAIISSAAYWDTLIQGGCLSQLLISSRPSSPQHFTMTNTQAWSTESNTWLRSPFNLRVPSSWKSLLPVEKTEKNHESHLICYKMYNRIWPLLSLVL